MSVIKIKSTTVRVISLASAIIFLGGTNFGQRKQVDDSAQIAAAEKLSLVSEIQGLGARAKLLDRPLARAMAQTEVADAAWFLDRDLAKQLLRESYDLLGPKEGEQSKLRKLPAGSPPRFPSAIENARWKVRRRIMDVARRDKPFADELIQSLTDQFGPFEAQLTFAELARDAIDQGDLDIGREYIRRAIDADPTQSNAAMEIGRLALKDRAAADQAIVEFINRLRSFTLSPVNGSKQRVFYSLAILVLAPEANPSVWHEKIAPPGPVAVRATLAYMLDMLTQMDSVGLSSSRGYLLAAWPLLERYSPELTQQFLDLEQRSRKPGENFSLPTTKSLAEESKAKYDKGVDKEIDSDHPDETVIRLAIGRQDFSKARKMIDKLADGPQKIELLDMLNTGQAVSLANKGDIPGARKLAESLVKAASILRVFPVIAAKCAATNDNVCARDTINQAVKQLKKADVTPFAPPPGVPASIMGTSKDFDPVLSSLGGLASAVISVKDELALDVLDELVIAANNSELDTGLGRTGFETSLFKKLADKNEARVNLAAMQLKDPLRQIIALAAIDQWKSDKLTAEAKLRNVKNESTSKKN